jgi:hypothetical protein
MAKSLSERIAERAKAAKQGKGGRNRAIVLALREDIKGALDDGWPVKAIWETLHEEGKVPFGYQSFRNYVNRLILEKQEVSAPTTADQQPEEKPEPGKTAKPEGIAGFKFNSIANKEELL